MAAAPAPPESSGGWDDAEWAAAERAAPAAEAAPGDGASDGAERAAASETPPALTLEEAVARIPAPARRQLEDLFRGRFVGVKRIRREDLR